MPKNRGGHRGGSPGEFRAYCLAEWIAENWGTWILIGSLRARSEDAGDDARISRSRHLNSTTAEHRTSSSPKLKYCAYPGMAFTCSRRRGRSAICRRAAFDSTVDTQVGQRTCAVLSEGVCRPRRYFAHERRQWGPPLQTAWSLSNRYGPGDRIRFLPFNGERWTLSLRESTLLWRKSTQTARVRRLLKEKQLLDLCLTANCRKIFLRSACVAGKMSLALSKEGPEIDTILHSPSPQPDQACFTRSQVGHRVARALREHFSGGRERHRG